MNDRELTDALQAYLARQPAPAFSAGQLTADLIRQDKRRVGLLTVVTVLLWLAAVAGLLALAVGLDRLVIYLRSSDASAAARELPADPHALAPAFENMLWGTSLVHHIMPLAIGGIVALLLAALSTVLLVFSSRRATLRQINVSLLHLCEQQRQMRTAT